MAAALAAAATRATMRSNETSSAVLTNITFDNLAPLSTYLGKPGNTKLHGISFDEYKKRQAQHCEAEIHALQDVPSFIARAKDIYRYDNFICDSGGSLCEVVNPQDPDDPVLRTLAENTVLLYIEGTPEHARMLVERFRRQPKPMYYQPPFLQAKWAEYKSRNAIANDDDVAPDGFAVWGFEQLLHHRIPLYRAIAQNFGYTIPMSAVPGLQNEQDFVALVADAIDQAQS